MSPSRRFARAACFCLVALFSAPLAAQPAAPDDDHPGCQQDEHGTVCALVEDEVRILTRELSDTEDALRSGLCGPGPGWKIEPKSNAPPITIDVVSPDGDAQVRLRPGPTAIVVHQAVALQREPVRAGCALLKGKPAIVDVGAVVEGRQRVTIRARPSTPLRIEVVGNHKGLTGTLHAFPPFDWPDTPARVAILTFKDGVAMAPERVPTPIDDPEGGVWSVVEVRAGDRVAARLVAPGERVVRLTLGKPAVIRVRVRQAGKDVKVGRYWFEDRWPGLEMTCRPEDSLTRWGEVELEKATASPTIQAAPGARRCLFVQVENEGDRAGEIVGVRVPGRAGWVERGVEVARGHD